MALRAVQRTEPPHPYTQKTQFAHTSQDAPITNDAQTAQTTVVERFLIKAVFSFKQLIRYYSSLSVNIRHYLLLSGIIRH